LNPAARKQLTIVAPATAMQMAAVGIIRVSGSKAFEITEKIFSKKLSDKAGYTLHFGQIFDHDRLIDEVLVSVFQAPHSYTGENVVEISCHGSPYIVNEITQLLIKNGASAAEPGEFTLRAFLNGKMDLSQAEAVADLIASESKAGHQLAIQQMKGGISKLIQHLRSELVHFSAMLELELDFSTEDVEFADRKELTHLLNKILQTIKQLLGSFSLGNALKKGIPVCIAGRPNAGKSTLLNALLNDEKAIVSDIEGTTRDSIEDYLNYKGIQFRIIDTAGIRKTTDTIESMGIERSFARMNEADYILYLFDLTNSSSIEVSNDIAELKLKFGKEKQIILIANKADLYHKDFSESDFPSKPFLISAKNNEGVMSIFEYIVNDIQTKWNAKNEIITNNRHFEALMKCELSLIETLEKMHQDIPSDLLAFHVRDALQNLALITGEVTNDEVLGLIFGKFCIGK
jgi:tRNA modification GTPase